MFKKFLITLIFCFQSLNICTLKSFEDFDSFNFDDIDITNVDPKTNEQKKSLLEKISLLNKAMEGMSPKEKTFFILSIIKIKSENAKDVTLDHILRNQKKYTVALFVSGITIGFLIGKLIYDKKQQR